MCEDSDIPTFSAFQSHSSRREFCSSDSCSAIHNSDNPKDICTVAGCPFESIDMEPCLDPYPAFYYAYGDGSLRGELMRNKLKWKNISKILAKYQLNQEFFGFILLSLKRESIGNIEKLLLTSWYTTILSAWKYYGWKKCFLKNIKFDNIMIFWNFCDISAKYWQNISWVRSFLDLYCLVWRGLLTTKGLFIVKTCL